MGGYGKGNSRGPEIGCSSIEDIAWDHIAITDINHDVDDDVTTLHRLVMYDTTRAPRAVSTSRARGRESAFL